MQDTDTDTKFDHNAEGFQHDRWNVYRELRAHCPVAYSSAHGGFWTIARYEDVFSVARDDETFSSSSQVIIPANDVQPLIPLESDPPELARYRALLTPFLSPKAVKQLEPTIASIIDESLSRLLPAGGGEFVEELCDPLPARTTLAILGLDLDYRLFSRPLHAQSYAEPGSPEHQQGIRDTLAFDALLEDAVDARIREPRHDMISSLLASEHNGKPTTREEVVSLVRMVVFGGFDTVFAALGTILVTLGRRKDLRQTLIEDRSRIPTAIEEFLRFDAPVQGFARKVMRPCVIGDRHFKRGDLIFMLWASANRDETVFNNPDQLILDRKPNRHMTFGIGGHRCLGSTLARTELRLALDRILETIPDYELVEQGVEHPRSIGIIAGLKRVPLLFSPRDLPEPGTQRTAE